MNLEKCGPGQSMFSIIDKYKSPYVYGYAIHRVFTLMRKLGAKSILVEMEFDQELGARLDVEQTALRERFENQQLQCTACRLTFTNEDLHDVSQVNALPEIAFLGYLVLNTFRTADQNIPEYTYVFESVVREPGRFLPTTSTWEPLLNNYLHVQRPFQCRVGDRKYALPGTFFCQQNGVTSVCAHACTSMVITNSCQNGSIVTCEDINKKIGIDHKTRMMNAALGAENTYATNAGLTNLEIIAAFHRYELETNEFQCYERSQRLHFRSFLYGFIESGFPAILMFSTAHNISHVVAVVGHTLNSDSWFPLAFSRYAPRIARVENEEVHRPYLTTLDWVTDFIVHDDNFGMCLCLPGHSFRPEEHVDPSMAFMPVMVLGVCPLGTPSTLRSFDAQAVAHHRLHELFDVKTPVQKTLLNSLVSPYYGFHLFSQLKEETAVFRAILATPQKYLAHLEQPDHLGVKLTPDQLARIRAPLQGYKQFWLVEVTIPDLYVGNKTKLADIAIDPSYRFDKKDKGPAGILFMRLPGVLLTPQNDPSAHYVVESSLAVQAHMPLYALDSSRLSSSSW